MKNGPKKCRRVVVRSKQQNDALFSAEVRCEFVPTGKISKSSGLQTSARND